MLVAFNMYEKIPYFIIYIGSLNITIHDKYISINTKINNKLKAFNTYKYILRWYAFSCKNFTNVTLFLLSSIDTKS